MKINWAQRFKQNSGDNFWHNVKSQYEKSSEWGILRRAVLKRAGGKCERCGMPFRDGLLQIHHLTYDRIGAEKQGDLQALCFRCHQEADEEREDRTLHRREQSRFAARVGAHAEKCWGEMWEQEHDEEDAESKFIYDMNKKWCKMNHQHFTGDLFEIDKWFEDALRAGKDLEDISSPHQDNTSGYLD